MLDYYNKKRVLENFKNTFNISGKRNKAAREWIAAFSLLNEEDQLQLITQFERSQSNTIVKGMTAKDKSIQVPGLGSFKINNIRAMFVDKKSELSGTTTEERKEMMKEFF